MRREISHVHRPQSLDDGSRDWTWWRRHDGIGGRVVLPVCGARFSRVRLAGGVARAGPPDRVDCGVALVRGASGHLHRLPAVPDDTPGRLDRPQPVSSRAGPGEPEYGLAAHV